MGIGYGCGNPLRFYLLTSSISILPSFSSLPSVVRRLSSVLCRLSSIVCRPSSVVRIACKQAPTFRSLCSLWLILP